MSSQYHTDGATDQGHHDVIAVTRRGVVERLADPYLTDHDRWVLRQFASFLGGVAPGPDPRAVSARTARPLHRIVRRTRV